MNKKNALKVEKLTKIYFKKSSNEIKALNNLNLEVKEGEIFGLLGPNGAGKTTFLNILAGTVIKNSGSVNVWGYDLDKNPRQVRSSIGIVPQEVNLDAFFSPKNLLELQAGLYGIPKKDRITDTILKLVSLEKEANAYARSLSGGMKRRLLIAKAMVHRPPILVLDEPTAGVDVKLRQNLWNNVKVLNKQGVTIILTTHLMYEAEEMCNRIAILNKGNLVTLDTTENLLDRIKTKKIIFKVKEINKINPKDLNGIKFSYSSNNEITALYERKKHKIDQIINKVKSAGMEIYDISTDEGNLEDVFIDLTKN
ncbi:MAG TPA: ABC transporter ATP-binding protein [Pelagibacteraceae bacterium]|jgi:ABC-2 type transport system ATP-binding protein|nr:ABC transporter ATP-binding protein [Pelagibacteraceae bacterium]